MGSLLLAFPCHDVTMYWTLFNTLRQRRNEQHFADDIFKRIFFNENVWISIKISQRFVPKGPINNITVLVQIMTWRRSGDKPLSEPMMVRLLTHICVARPQWVKTQLLELYFTITQVWRLLSKKKTKWSSFHVFHECCMKDLKRILSTGKGLCFKCSCMPLTDCSVTNDFSCVMNWLLAQIHMRDISLPVISDNSI